MWSPLTTTQSIIINCHHQVHWHYIFNIIDPSQQTKKKNLSSNQKNRERILLQKTKKKSKIPTLDSSIWLLFQGIISNFLCVCDYLCWFRFDNFYIHSRAGHLDFLPSIRTFCFVPNTHVPVFFFFWINEIMMKTACNIRHEIYATIVCLYCIHKWNVWIFVSETSVTTNQIINAQKKIIPSDNGGFKSHHPML